MSTFKTALALILAGAWLGLTAVAAPAKETEIEWADVPKAVKAAIQSRVDDDQVTEIVKKEFKGKVIYEFEVQKDGRELDYSFDPDGKFLGIEGEHGEDVKAESDESPEHFWSDRFDVDKITLRPTGRNPYFILEPGYRLEYKGKSGKKEELLTITVLNDTRVVDGVVTRVVEERESKGGKLVEVSRNYFAFDPATRNVYYFGEEVDMYGKDGKVKDHEGAWLSGEAGAKFGLIMPGEARVGYRHYQELAEDVAMDRAEIVSLTDTITTPSGAFSNCLKVEETTPLEPGHTEYKLYAPGVGLVQDASLLLVKYGFTKK